MQSDEAKKAYWAAHIDPATAIGSRNGGAHFTYIAKLAERYGSEGWAVGSGLTIADILLYDITDVHLRAFGVQFSGAYPDLVTHHARVAALPGIKAYVGSSKQFDKVNNNGLG